MRSSFKLKSSSEFASTPFKSLITKHLFFENRLISFEIEEIDLTFSTLNKYLFVTDFISKSLIEALQTLKSAHF